MHRLDAKPGQFFVWRFLDGAGWSRGHPFSLAAAPTIDALDISARLVGDGTERLRTLRPGTRVLVEGPYGRMTGDERTARKLLMIGAGAGVAPLVSILEGHTGRARRRSSSPATTTRARDARSRDPPTRRAAPRAALRPDRSAIGSGRGCRRRTRHGAAIACSATSPPTSTITTCSSAGRGRGWMPSCTTCTPPASPSDASTPSRSRSETRHHEEDRLRTARDRERPRAAVQLPDVARSRDADHGCDGHRLRRFTGTGRAPARPEHGSGSTNNGSGTPAPATLGQPLGLLGHQLRLVGLGHKTGPGGRLDAVRPGPGEDHGVGRCHRRGRRRRLPQRDRRDQEINQVAIPMLVSETLSAKSAQIDMISGATYTSEGYVQSLQSAIDEASRELRDGAAPPPLDVHLLATPAAGPARACRSCRRVRRPRNRPRRRLSRGAAAGRGDLLAVPRRLRRLAIARGERPRRRRPARDEVAEACPRRAGHARPLLGVARRHVRPHRIRQGLGGPVARPPTCSPSTRPTSASPPVATASATSRTTRVWPRGSASRTRGTPRPCSPPSRYGAARSRRPAPPIAVLHITDAPHRRHPECRRVGDGPGRRPDLGRRRRHRRLRDGRRRPVLAARRTGRRGLVVWRDGRSDVFG